MNSIGQRTNVSTSGTAFPATPSWTWGYDSLGQVISADHSTDNNSDRAYQYDAIGNRKKSADSLILPADDNYTSNALNQYSSLSLNSQPATLNDYDDDGNLTSGQVPTGSAGLVWDAENRLIAVSVIGQDTIHYAYDAQSRRISRSVGVSPTASNTIYIYDAWNVIAEYSIQNSTSTIQNSYLWGTDLSGSLQGAGGVGGLLSVRIHDPQSAIYYPTYDGNGNVSEYLAADGSTAAHFEYDPFGNTVVNTDTSNLFAYRFSTKPLDQVTGLYYYGYRYYDSVTGRWPSRDPIEELGGMNLYSFIYSNVINTADNLGLIDIALTCEELASSAWRWGKSAAVTVECAASEAAVIGGRAIITVGGGIVAVLACTCGTAGGGGDVLPLDDSIFYVLPKVDEKEVADCELLRRARGCRPCNPPVGTILYEVVPPGDRESGKHSRPPFNRGHVKLWKAAQTPYPTCKCVWNKNTPFTLEDSQTPPPYLNAIPGTPKFVPITGGGPY